jgi:hypothetical protein
MEDLSTMALIGQRYLDTRHSREYLERLEAELRRRDVTGARRLGLEYLACSSLWWNILWWEWANLDERDVRLGWGMNLVAFTAPTLAAGLATSPTLAAATCGLLHLATTLVGLRLRAGTAPDD